jgi:hypothetical protein
MRQTIFTHLGRKSRHWVLLCFILCCASNPAQGDTLKISYSVTRDGQRINQNALLSGHVLLAQRINNDPDQDMRFDAEQHALYLINHQTRSYKLIDIKTIDEVAALVDSAARLLGPSSGLFGGILQGLGLDGTSEPDVPMDTGKTLRVGNYPCRLYRSNSSGHKSSELCLASTDSLKLQANEIEVLRVFIEFATLMVSRAENLVAVLGVTIVHLGVPGDQGLPIAMYTARNDSEVRLRRLDRTSEQVPSRATPTNYARAQLPFLTN